MKNLKALIEEVLRLSGQPESAADIEQKLVASGKDLMEYVDARASTRATIQHLLERLPPRNVLKFVRPGGESKFQWVFTLD